jgi:hypothetical protein
MRSQMALENGLQKLVHFLGFALRLQLHPAVGKIRYPSDYIKPLSDLPDRKTEADALDATLEKSSFR